MSGVVIVGAGHGGVQLAASLRDEGYSQDITLISSELDLPYHKPPLSKSFMKTLDAPLQNLRGVPFYDDKNINLKLGETVTSIDRNSQAIHFESGNSLSYQHLVLATGMRSRMLDITGANLQGVYTLRTAVDARKMRQGLPETGTVVVIGGGFIGLEAAAMLRLRGLDVTVVEVAERLLGRAVSPSIARAVQSYLESIGINILCGESVDSIIGEQQVQAVQLSSLKQLKAECVVVGIGGIPDDQLAVNAELDINNGIVVDQFLKTSEFNIYAIGDSASFPFDGSDQNLRIESVQNATDQARALAKTLCGQPTEYSAIPWFWSDIGHLKLQIVGFAIATDDQLEVIREDATLQSVWRYQMGQLTVVETLNSSGEHMIARKSLQDTIELDRKIIQSGNINQLKTAYREAIS